MGKLTEQKLVLLIIDFFNKNPDENEMDKSIQDYVNKNNLDDNDQGILRSALEVQFQAWQRMKTGRFFNYKSTYIEYILAPCWHTSDAAVVDSCQSASREACNSGSDNYLLAGLVCPVCCTAIVAYGVKNNLVEMGRELFNNQRVAANLLTIGLTSAYVIAVLMTVTATFVTKPENWSIVAVVAGMVMLVITTAIALKGIRYVANRVDATNVKGSGLAKDSRFQLLPKEIERLKEIYGVSPEQINSIKGMIRALAIKAHFLRETGFFGSNEKYLEVIKVLVNVKNGNIPKGMQYLYQLGPWVTRQGISRV